MSNLSSNPHPALDHGPLHSVTGLPCQPAAAGQRKTAQPSCAQARQGRAAGASGRLRVDQIRASKHPRRGFTWRSLGHRGARVAHEGFPDFLGLRQGVRKGIRPSAGQHRGWGLKSVRPRDPGPGPPAQRGALVSRYGGLAQAGAPVRAPRGRSRASQKP